MALDPQTHRVLGFRSAYDGSVYGPPGADRRLLGLGMPPSDPVFQAQNPGQGRLALSRSLVIVAEIPTQYRPAEDRWRHDPDLGPAEPEPS